MNTINDKSLQNYATTITSSDLAPLLFAINGDIKVQNLVFDCTNVSTGFLIKEGNVTFENCYFFGRESSSVNEAFNLSENCSLNLENCVIANFGTALNANNAKLIIKKCEFKNCNTAIVFDDNSCVMLTDLCGEMYREYHSKIFTVGREGRYIGTNENEGA